MPYFLRRHLYLSPATTHARLTADPSPPELRKRASAPTHARYRAAGNIRAEAGPLALEMVLTSVRLRLCRSLIARIGTGLPVLPLPARCTVAGRMWRRRDTGFGLAAAEANAAAKGGFDGGFWVLDVKLAQEPLDGGLCRVGEVWILQGRWGRRWRWGRGSTAWGWDVHGLAARRARRAGRLLLLLLLPLAGRGCSTAFWTAWRLLGRGRRRLLCPLRLAIAFTARATHTRSLDVVGRKTTDPRTQAEADVAEGSKGVDSGQAGELIREGAVASEVLRMVGSEWIELAGETACQLLVLAQLLGA